MRGVQATLVRAEHNIIYTVWVGEGRIWTPVATGFMYAPETFTLFYNKVDVSLC